MSTKSESIQAMQSSGAVVTQQERILSHLCKDGRFPLTRHEIAHGLRLRDSSVTGRLNELVRKGLVRTSGTTYDADTQRKVKLYMVA